VPALSELYVETLEQYIELLEPSIGPLLGNIDNAARHLRRQRAVFRWPGDVLQRDELHDQHAIMRGLRDREMEAAIQKMTQSLGVGAQFGGKYFCHDVRVIRLPRHGASLPIGLGVSCSADRQALGKITKDGVFLEELERNPAKYLPEVDTSKLGGEVVKIEGDPSAFKHS